MNYKIALIRGDGIGPEVVGEAVKVLEAVGQKFGHSFTYEEVLLGGCATDAVGKSYPDGTAEKCRACDAVLLGARVFRTQEVAVAEGDLALMGEGKLKLSYLSADAQLLSGDVVTTSGLGGFYPGGLVIGTVESVRTGDDGLAQYAVLAPAARLGELSEVFIIKDFDIVD